VSCEGRYADANDFAAKFCEAYDEDSESEINRLLELAAGNINAARAAQGACDCALASWAEAYLIDLNCVIALVTYNCPCTTIRALSSADRAVWAEWANNQLALIRTGQVELCDGETGPDFPAADFIQQSLTEWTAAQIVQDTVARGS
jgi:hypothetical protein